jgi:hypothetical protein
MKLTTKLQRTFSLLLLAIISTTVAGCGWRSNTGDSVPINVADFYQPSRSWTYQETAAAGNSTYTVKVVNKTQYHGTESIRVDSYSQNSPQQMRQYIAFAATKGTILGTEIVDTTTGTITDSPVLPGVSFPSLLAVGTPLVSEYETTEANNKIHWTVKAEILSTARETVTVPAGVFRQAIKVHTRVTTTRDISNPQTSDTSVIEEYTWYAPQVGMVQSQTSDGARVTVLVKST